MDSSRQTRASLWPVSEHCFRGPAGKRHLRKPVCYCGSWNRCNKTSDPILRLETPPCSNSLHSALDKLVWSNIQSIASLGWCWKARRLLWKLKSEQFTSLNRGWVCWCAWENRWNIENGCADLQGQVCRGEFAHPCVSVRQWPCC